MAAFFVTGVGSGTNPFLRLEKLIPELRHWVDSNLSAPDAYQLDGQIGMPDPTPWIYFQWRSRKSDLRGRFHLHGDTTIRGVRELIRRFEESGGADFFFEGKSERGPCLLLTAGHLTDGFYCFKNVA